MPKWQLSLVHELRARRRRLKLRQDYVAARIGVCANRISLWELGKARPSLDLLEAWGQTLKLKLKWEQIDDP